MIKNPIERATMYNHMVPDNVYQSANGELIKLKNKLNNLRNQYNHVDAFTKNHDALCYEMKAVEMRIDEVLNSFKQVEKRREAKG